MEKFEARLWTSLVSARGKNRALSASGHKQKGAPGACLDWLSISNDIEIQTQQALSAPFLLN
ncbi:hypothetical protein N5J23_05520 [Comamonas aquatica]|uniref:Uncharacterized protein n=1 Tax=Comamonas aquatica TaxID=225991 RepID=A0AA43AX03_9BURK|nr:hypothetical protein [Comamonas aquatica]MDH1427312.1 hypothetical protein [Comamonas aquatica]MDH1605062.1 hypothetical protein [Comamonas aquatica]MDH1617178.1 hypothetical protein [Comamonas aquatica]MDH2005006.1 hypothetical protein [Comamonas aquatica]